MSRILLALLLGASALALATAPGNAQVTEKVFRWKGGLMGVTGNGDRVCAPGEDSPRDCDGTCEDGEEGSRDCGGPGGSGHQPGPGGDGGGNDGGDDGEGNEGGGDGDGGEIPGGNGGDDGGQTYQITWDPGTPFPSSWQDWENGEFVAKGALMTGGVPSKTSFTLGETIPLCFDVGGVEFPGLGMSEPGELMAFQATMEYSAHWVVELSHGGQTVDPNVERITFAGATGPQCLLMKTGVREMDDPGFGPVYARITISVQTYEEVPEAEGCLENLEWRPGPLPEAWQSLCLQDGGETGISVGGTIDPYLPGPWNN